MITTVNQNTYEYRGLSTDEKPISDFIGNGSVFIEIDTGKVFIFDEQNKTWREL